MTSTLPTFDSLLNMRRPSKPNKWPSNRWRHRNKFWPNARLKLSKKSPLQKERLNPFLWWLRDRPKPMMPYHGRSARSSCSTRALRNGMGFYLKSLGEPSPSSIWGRWVARRAKQKEAKNKLRVQGWEFEVGSHR